jgi:hypothetical protein
MTGLRLLLFLTLFSTTSISGQVVQKKINSAIETLRNRNVDTFLVYSYWCNGGLIPLDSCLSEDTQYLFWRQDKSNYLQRFDYCKDYVATKLDTTNPFTFFINNVKIIRAEEIKAPTSVEIKRTNKGIDTIVSNLTISHSCFHRYELYLKKKLTKKSVNTFYLEFVKFDDGKTNIYRKYNRQTKLYTLTKLTSDLLKRLNYSVD